MKTGFFQDEHGNNSINRIAFIALVAYSMVITTIIAVSGDYAYAMAMFTTITGVAYGGKLYQKHQEQIK